MRFTYIDEMPILEHDSVSLYITESEYKQLRHMDASATRKFLETTVLSRLGEGKESRILDRWLKRRLLDIKPNEVHSCPSHLLSSSQFFVESISLVEKDYIADLPNLDAGRRVLILEPNFDDVRKIWEEGRTALLEFSGGSVRSDGVLVPSSIKVAEQDFE